MVRQSAQRRSDGCTRISVRVQPRSSKNALEWEDDILKAHLTTPPVEGAANAALIRLLATNLHIPKRSITIVHGLSSRQKLIEIEGLTLEQIADRTSRKV